MSSSIFTFLLRLTAGWNFEVGIIQRTPVPDRWAEQQTTLSELARSAVDLKRSLDTPNETSHLFHLPALLQVPGETLADRKTIWREREADVARRLAEHQREIDDIAFQLYGIEGEDRRAMEGWAGVPAEAADGSDDEGGEDE